MLSEQRVVNALCNRPGLGMRGDGRVQPTQRPVDRSKKRDAGNEGGGMADTSRCRYPRLDYIESGHIFTAVQERDRELLARVRLTWAIVHLKVQVVGGAAD